MSFTIKVNLRDKREVVITDHGKLTRHIKLPGGGWLVGNIRFNNGYDENYFLSLLTEKKFSSNDLYDLVSQISHQFFFAFFSDSEQGLYLIKDFSGCEPGYYTIEDSSAIISSSAISVVKNQKCVKINESGAFSFIYFEMPWRPETLFTGVNSVLNGAIYEYCNEKSVFIIHDHFSLGDIHEATANTDSLRKKIAEAHEKRVGKNNAIYLSGGLDSQVMSIALRKDIGVKDVHAYNFTVKGAANSEQEDAKQTADQLGIDFTPVEVDPNTLIDFDRSFLEMNSPYLGAVALNTLLSKVHADEDLTFFGGQDTRLHTPSLTKADILYWKLSKYLGHFGSVGNLASYTIRKVSNGNISDKAYRYCTLLESVGEQGGFLINRHFHIHNYDFVKDEVFNNNSFQELKQSLNEIDLARGRVAYNKIVEKNWRKQYLFDIEYMIETTRKGGFDCVMPFYDADLSKFSASLNFNDATRFTKGRDGHSKKTISVNKYLLRRAYDGDLDNSLIYRDKAVCPTSYMFFNGGLKHAVNEFIYDNPLLDTDLGSKLKINSLIRVAKQNHGRWKPEDNSILVSIFNAIVVSRSYKYFKCQNI